MHDHSHEHEEHSTSLWHELFHHLPYAIFSVAASLIVLSLVTNVSSDQSLLPRANSLFHSLHFLHIIFAATGTVLTFLRFSSSYSQALLIGIVSPVIFCSLSDAVLPYYGGRLLGVPMHWHVCFYTELANVLPFLFVGILNGFVMARHHYAKLLSFSVGSHFVHILVSSLAASFFLVANGFANWAHSIGYVFLFLIGAVLLPCTISDVVIPMLFARARKR